MRVKYARAAQPAQPHSHLCQLKVFGAEVAALDQRFSGQRGERELLVRARVHSQRREEQVWTPAWEETAIIEYVTCCRRSTQHQTTAPGPYTLAKLGCPRHAPEVVSMLQCAPQHGVRDPAQVVRLEQVYVPAQLIHRVCVWWGGVLNGQIGEKAPGR